MTPTVTREEALALEGVERAAWRDLVAAATDDDRAALGLRVLDTDGVLALACEREESLLWNRALGLGLTTSATPAQVDALIAHYRGRVPGFAINLCPFAEPADTVSWLRARGFETWFHHLKWVRGPGEVPAPTRGIEVRRAGPDDAATWAAIAAGPHAVHPAVGEWKARAVGREGWTHLLAYDQGRPVAAAALYKAANAAWLGLAVTLESHRRRGAHEALLAARITWASEQGARVLTLETGPDWPDVPGESLRNARRAGFRVAYERPSWLWPVG